MNTRIGLLAEGGVKENATGNRPFVFALVGLYLLGLGVLTGMLIEKIRFNEARNGLLTKLDQDAHRLRERLMALERGTVVERQRTR